MKKGDIQTVAIISLVVVAIIFLLFAFGRVLFSG